MQPTFRTELCPCFDGLLIAGRHGVARDLRGARRETERQQALLLGWPTLGRNAGAYRRQLKRVVKTSRERWDRRRALREDLERLAALIDHMRQLAPPYPADFPTWLAEHIESSRQVGKLWARVDPDAVEDLCAGFVTQRFVGSSHQSSPIEALPMSPERYERVRMEFARILYGNLCDCSAEWIKRRLQPRHAIASTTVVNVDLNDLQAVADRRLW